VSQFRNISGDDRQVVYGVRFPTEIVAGGILTIEDDADEAYDHQSTIWEVVTAQPVVPPAVLAPVAPVEPAATPAV
jgi:hypothetical protein